MVLEKDFLDTERYISFDLGDNYLYTSQAVTDLENSNAFSNEFVKQYQTIGSEVDVLLKTICQELGDNSADKMPSYTTIVLNHWNNLPNQKVKMNNIQLQPFKNWEINPYNPPDWWSQYNRVKHERLNNFRMANLKNVVNSLAGLFILESYLVKLIGDRDNTKDVPNDVSKVFELVGFQTRDVVVGRETYLIKKQDIDECFKSID